MNRVTRFAPSPSGELHLGHVFAAKVACDTSMRDRGGTFLLRMEDIDGGRVREEFYHKIEADLHWLGLDWDGAILRQSDRMEAYESSLEELKRLGLVYPCFCTRKDIEAEIAVILSAPHGNEAMVYPGICRNLTEQQAAGLMAAGKAHSWRFDSSKAREIHGSLSFDDQKFGLSPVNIMVNGDVVLARKDIGIAYHLAVVVDDQFQGVTHVTRGEDLFGATHVQRQIQAILGYREPKYFHHPLICDENGVRLAKRDAARSVGNLREVGFSPEEVMAMACPRI
ncbi:MAG: tRNA glutamyl-Q(34) synthetase GluQRS [Armatimonadetes bacterium]|nr:tRNA glutamyl-Q(34) synthetase GluQRS [Akkermansiaceae bacterium]